MRIALGDLCLPCVAVGWAETQHNASGGFFAQYGEACSWKLARFLTRLSKAQTLRTVAAMLRRQCFVAGPSAVAQHLPRPSPRVSRGVAARDVPTCVVFPMSQCAMQVARFQRVLFPSCGLRRCGPRCCAALRCPKMLAPRAQFANRFRDAPLAALRCLAVRRRPTPLAPFAGGVAGCCRAGRCDSRACS